MNLKSKKVVEIKLGFQKKKTNILGFCFMCVENLPLCFLPFFLVLCLFFFFFSS